MLLLTWVPCLLEKIPVTGVSLSLSFFCRLTSSVGFFHNGFCFPVYLSLGFFHQFPLLFAREQAPDSTLLECIDMMREPE